jgi:EAL domain-containing protein (putative c-di-GMP-specific phosphodiesterase class I)
MEAGNVGVNSPEFLNKKVDRLKRALEEANQLMDRHVAERDEARAQAVKAQQELAALKRRVGEGGDAPAPAAGGDAAPASSAEADELRSQLEGLHAELDRTRSELDSTRTRLVDAEVAAPAGAPAPADGSGRVIAAGASRRPSSVTDLPAGGGPFVDPDLIRRALAEDGFVLFCQPVFSLKDEAINQYELLLRMKDDQGRLVRPFAFLEPADRYGLMPDIDKWVVRRALDLLTDDASGQLRLEVNIAGQTIADRDLTAIIEQQVAVTDLDPARLILEVSENVAASNLETTEALAKRLRGLGCGFALDDFGSTFASFRHLRDLPINYLKLDGDLIVTVVESRTGQLTIKSLVDLANGIGAETIAEYVSDDQTLEFLREQGVGYAQGYRIGRPRPLEEVIPGSGKPPERPGKKAAPAAPAATSDDAEETSETSTR